jgi:flagellar protein FlgJ
MKLSELSSASIPSQIPTESLTAANNDIQQKLFDVKKIKDLSKDFESVFMEQMFKTMRESVQKSGLIDGGNAEDIYRSMLDSEYAKSMATQGSTGIASMIERQLLESMGVKREFSSNLQRLVGTKTYESTQTSPLQTQSKPAIMK